MMPGKVELPNKFNYAAVSGVNLSLNTQLMKGFNCYLAGYKCLYLP